MNYLKKLIIIFLNLTVFVSCTSNIPNNTFELNKVISIDKPKITYEVKKLPKRINIFLSDTKSIKEKEFINGFLMNYYYFKNQINYSRNNFHNKKRVRQEELFFGCKER